MNVCMYVCMCVRERRERDRERKKERVANTRFQALDHVCESILREPHRKSITVNNAAIL
jgi:hypothetical protein